MAKNQYQSALDKANTTVDEHYAKWEAVDKLILKISKSTAENVGKGFSSGLPKDLEARTQKNAKAVNYLNETLKEQKRLEDSLVKALVKKEQASSDLNKALIKQRLETNEINKQNRLQEQSTNRVLGAYKNVSAQLTQLRKTYKDLGAKQLQGIKLTKEEKKQFDRLLPSIKKLDKGLKQLDNSAGQNQRSVGKYSDALKGFKNVMVGLVGAFGAVEVARMALNFGKESLELARQAKGVEFAFNRLGVEGQEAFEKIKTSTRGLLSDLEIKTSLSEFDQFNLSLERTDTLFEFLAVAAAQTGKSVDELKSSLVEGLSKESKLRIDNLGISVTELNAELEKTPEFIDAVANIAERKIAAAGDILDEAANSQERFNAALENFQVRAGSGFIGSFTNSVYDLGVSFLSLTSDVSEASDGVWDFLLNSIRAVDPLQAKLLKAEAIAKRAQRERLSLTEKIIVEQKKLGIEEEVIMNNRIQLEKLGVDQLRNIYKSYLSDRKKQLNGETGDLEFQRAKQISILQQLAEQAEKTKAELSQLFQLGLIDAAEFSRELDKINNAIKDLTNLTQSATDLRSDATITADTSGLLPVENTLNALKEGLDNLEWDDALDRASEFFGEIGNFASALRDRNIQAIEDEINANDLKYANILNNEQLTQEQRSAIEAEQELKRQELEKKKREEQNKQAKAQKAFSAAQVIANTAVAISKTLAETGVFGIPLTAIVAAQGALQLATVLAQPIPQFKDGLHTDYEGKGIINDQKGRNFRELVLRRSGKAEMFEGRNKVIDIKKGDRIIPAMETSQILNNAIAMSAMDQDQKIANHQINIQNKAPDHTSMVKDFEKALRSMPRSKAFDYNKMSKANYYENRAHKA